MPWIKSALVLASCILTISGCTTVPGSNIDSNVFELPRGPFESPASEAVIIKISPDVIEGLIPTGSTKHSSFTAVPPVAYKVGPGDVLSIVVWDHPELTAPFGSFNNAEEQGNVVRADGTIFYPFVGALEVAGLDPAQIQEKLSNRLSEFIENPQLDVRIAAYRSQRFAITGAVNRPGMFAVKDVPVTIVEALSLAGGLAPIANLHDAKLTRGNKTQTISIYDILYEGKTEQNYVLAHGDVLHMVPNENRQVYVMGEVTRPQSLSMPAQDLTLTQALAEVGGIVESRANAKGVYVVRQSPYDNIVDVFQLDMTEAWALALGDEFTLQSRDIIYVTAAPITRWNRWVSNVLPSLQGLYNLNRLER